MYIFSRFLYLCTCPLINILSIFAANPFTFKFGKFVLKNLWKRMSLSINCFHLTSFFKKFNSIFKLFLFFSEFSLSFEFCLVTLSFFCQLECMVGRLCSVHSSNDTSLVKNINLTTINSVSTIFIFTHINTILTKYNNQISPFFWLHIFRKKHTNMSSIAALLQAAEYLERRERGKNPFLTFF